MLATLDDKSLLLAIMPACILWPQAAQKKGYILSSLHSSISLSSPSAIGFAAFTKCSFAAFLSFLITLTSCASPVTLDFPSLISLFSPENTVMRYSRASISHPCYFQLPLGLTLRLRSSVRIYPFPAWNQRSF